MQPKTQAAKRILTHLADQVKALDADINDALRDEVNRLIVQPYLSRIEADLAELRKVYQLPGPRSVP